MRRVLAHACGPAVAVLLAAGSAGCGSPAPPGAGLSDQQKQEQLKRDADQVMRERQEAAKARGR